VSDGSENSLSYRDSNSDHSIVQPVASCSADCPIAAPFHDVPFYNHPSIYDYVFQMVTLLHGFFCFFWLVVSFFVLSTSLLERNKLPVIFMSFLSLTYRYLYVIVLRKGCASQPEKR
jgi:hypothetical protein